MDPGGPALTPVQERSHEGTEGTLTQVTGTAGTPGEEAFSSVTPGFGFGVDEEAETSVTQRIERLRTFGEDEGLNEYIDFVQARLKINKTQTQALTNLYREQVRHVRGEFLPDEPQVQCWDTADVEATRRQLEGIQQECDILHDHVGQKLHMVERELSELNYIVKHRYKRLHGLETDESGHVLRTRKAFAKRFIGVARTMEEEIDNLRKHLSEGLTSVRRQINALSSAQII